MMKTLLSLAFMFLLVTIFLCGCSPNTQKPEARFLEGNHWYHPDRTLEKTVRDFQDCRAIAISAPSTYNPTNVEFYCMESKGYAWLQ